MSEAFKPVKRAFIAGVIFATLEAGCAEIWPQSLDPNPTRFAVVLSVVGTGLLLGLAAAVLSRFSARHAAGVAMAFWAVIWGPHQAKLVGWHRVGWAPAVVLGSTAILAPGLALVIGTMCGATGTIFRNTGGAAGIRPWSRAATQDRDLPNILMVTVSGIGDDQSLLEHGRWGSESSLSPIKGWTHFGTAIAGAPWTLPSMHGIMSSMPVTAHGGGQATPGGHTRRVSEAIPFPYVLQQGGYTSAAFVSSPFLSVEQGFADGFDQWHHGSQGQEPILLLAIYNEVLARALGSESELTSTTGARLSRAAVQFIHGHTLGPKFAWVQLSAGPSTKADLAKLLAATPSWVVAISADRGGGYGGGDLSDASLQVPLAIYRPNTQGGVVDRPVAVSDLGHTLLAAAGLAGHAPGQNLMTLRRKPIAVGGVFSQPNLFAARALSGGYIRRKPGLKGPGVHQSDHTVRLLQASGYLE